MKKKDRLSTEFVDKKSTVDSWEEYDRLQEYITSVIPEAIRTLVDAMRERDEDGYPTPSAVKAATTLLNKRIPDVTKSENKVQVNFEPVTFEFSND